jgi:hypothetical protein
METISITIQDEQLRQAAEKGIDEFIKVFTDSYMKTLGGELNGENMHLLNGQQISLLAYVMLRDEVLDGGFIQLIHNGYGPFIFDNPFAKAMRIMGAHDFSKLVYKGKKLYDKYKNELTKDCSDEEFMALFERYPEFDDLDDNFIEMEEEVTNILAHYVDEHIEEFAVIVKA